jgi:hypothetical protein
MRDAVTATSEPAHSWQDINARLHKLGVSWPELQGIPALLSTLAHLQRTRREAAAKSSGGVKLRLKVGGVQQKPQQLRIKGSIQAKEAAALQGVDVEAAKMASMYAAAVADDDADAFPAHDAAVEACVMGNCASPEALITELEARIDVFHSDYESSIAALYPALDPPSTLRRHDPTRSAKPVVSALAENDMLNTPKTSIVNLPIVKHTGGFGLYDGAQPTLSHDSEETHAGSGYHYNEQTVDARAVRYGDDVAGQQLDELLGTDSEGEEGSQEDEAYKDEDAESDYEDEDLASENSDDSVDSEPEAREDDLVVGERGALEDDWVDEEEVDEQGQVHIVRRRRNTSGIPTTRTPGNKSKRSSKIEDEDEGRKKRKRARKEPVYTDVFDKAYFAAAQAPAAASAVVDGALAGPTTKIMGAASRVRTLGGGKPTAAPKLLPSSMYGGASTSSKPPVSGSGAVDDDECNYVSIGGDDDDEPAHTAPSQYLATAADSVRASTVKKRGGAFAKPTIEHISLSSDVLAAASHTTGAGTTSQTHTGHVQTGQVHASTHGDDDDKEDDDDDDDSDLVLGGDSDEDGVSAAIVAPTYIPTLRGTVPSQSQSYGYGQGTQGGSALLRNKMKDARSRQRR